MTKQCDRFGKKQKMLIFFQDNGEYWYFHDITEMIFKILESEVQLSLHTSYL